MYSGYGITFDGASLWSFENDTAINVIISGNDDSLFPYSGNRKKNFLVLAEGSTFRINWSYGSPEMKFSINFSKASTKFCLSLNNNADNIRQNIFACLISVHTSCLSLSRHEQVCLIRLPFERHFTYYPQTKYLCRAYSKRICRPGRKQWNLWIRRNSAMWLIKIIRQIKLIRQKNLYGYKGDDFT